MKKCSPEKVSLIKCLRIDTLYTQNLDFITHELTCSRYDLAKVDFWQIQKLKISLSRKKSHMLIKSTVFNFLHIFQLIQTVLKSNFLNLVLNIHVQQGLEKRGFWFQKKAVQLKTALLEVYTYVLKWIFFQKTV
mgnify:CR=1 FL=1